MNNKQTSLKALDYSNLLLAASKDTIGPYLSVYLKSNYHFDSMSIGIAIASANFSGIISQIPAGAFIDQIHNKKIIIQIAAIFTTLSLIIILKQKLLFFIILAHGIIGLATATINPTISAISLGLVGQNKFARRVGRNEALIHVGNVFAAITTGIIGCFLGNQYIFYFIALLCILGVLSVNNISNNEIDFELARGGVNKDKNNQTQNVSLMESLKNRTVIILFITFFLFHFANAALLPGIGQKLSESNPHLSSLNMSVCIIIAQLVMIPTAIITSRLIPKIGIKKLFIIGFLSLPLRALLFSIFISPLQLILAQALDGISAGVFGVTSIVMISNAAKGSGRFNFIQGCASSIIGVGSCLSNLFSGYLIKTYGYHINFMILAVIAIMGIIHSLIFIDNTRN